MIAIAIIAILTAIALPAYEDYLRRGEVSEATNNLANYRVAMEQYYDDNKSYASPAGATSGAVCGAPNIVAPAAKYFTYSCALGTTAGTAYDQSYTMTATGMTGTLTQGFIYTINEQDVQATPATGVWGETSVNTWIIRK